MQESPINQVLLDQLGYSHWLVRFVPAGILNRCCKLNDRSVGLLKCGFEQGLNMSVSLLECEIRENGKFCGGWLRSGS